MVYLFFDASALAKRYVAEDGSQLVNYIFDVVPCERMACLMLGASEVISVLVRCRNRKSISSDLFAQAIRELREEVIDSGAFTKLGAPENTTEASMGFIDKHSVNATDALALRTALDLRDGLRLIGDSLVLVTSDERLFAAAEAEKLPVFDPEKQTQPQLDALLA